MDSKILELGYGIKGVDITKVEEDNGYIGIHIETKKGNLKCGECGSRNVIKRGYTIREFRDVPIGLRAVRLIAKVYRLECKNCLKLRQEKLSFAEKKNYTNNVKNLCLSLLSCMTIEDVSNYTGLHWHTIKKMDKEYLKRRYRKMDFRRVKYIAIDEFAVSKGHQYMTVVMDLETKRALYVKKGKDGASLREFWKEIKKQKVKIKAVAIDMSPAYIKSVTDHIGYDKIVFDWFHIKKKINFEIDELRREMYNEEKRLGIRQVMKGSRWLLLKNSENLNAEKDEKQKLEKVLQMNKPLATMYYMKEELTTMWWLGGKAKSEAYLQTWVLRAINSGIKQLIKVGNMIGSFRTAILRRFDFDISLSTGPLEGFNNKIKVLKRKAYGYRDIDYFGLKIFDLHNYRLKYALMR